MAVSDGMQTKAGEDTECMKAGYNISDVFGFGNKVYFLPPSFIHREHRVFSLCSVCSMVSVAILFDFFS